MAKILLDYLFPITAIEPTAAASTAFLKQVCLVVARKDSGVTYGVITKCTSMSAVGALTSNTEAQQFFNAGMAAVYILPMANLDLASALDGHESDFFTIVISSDFADAAVTLAKAHGTVTISSYANLVSGTHDSISVAGVSFVAQGTAATLGDATFQAATSNSATGQSLADQINAHPTASLLVSASNLAGVVTITAKDYGSAGNDIAVSYTDNDTNVGATLAGLSGGKLAGGAGLLLGTFKGVSAVASSDDSVFLPAQAAIENRCAFYSAGNGAKNMCYAFGKLLSNALDWRNQQYITMPFADDVGTVGDADSLFDSKISFVISDSEYGMRLALFCAGGKAMTAPYIKKNLMIDLQSEALSYISANQPEFTHTQAALLQDELNKVLQSYIIDKKWIADGTVSVSLAEDNFVAGAEFNISEPKALWRIFGEMRQTL